MRSGKPVAVVVGAIGKLPYAGVSAYYLHYVRGLQELGYAVHYVERQNKEAEYYDPSTREMTDDLRPALSYLSGVGAQFGAQPDAITLLDRGGVAHGTPLDELVESLTRAEFVLTIADATWFDELSACPRRAFIDGDPMFTQASLSHGDPLFTAVADHNPTLFSYGTRIGLPGCTIPDCGRSWIPTRPVVATSLWPVTPVVANAPVTALLHWSAGSDLVVDGTEYGHKDREMEKFVALPERTRRTLSLAVGGKRAPREALAAAGWILTDPLASTSDAAAYRNFISGSRADLGIAKHAYVASQSGWFSDRATCFLASGRPVLHQDTGFGDWLPETDGVLTFHDLASAEEALRRLDENYEAHVRASRRVAEEWFEARTVIAQMLEAAGFR